MATREIGGWRSCGGGKAGPVCLMTRVWWSIFVASSSACLCGGGGGGECQGVPVVKLWADSSRV